MATLTRSGPWPGCPGALLRAPVPFLCAKAWSPDSRELVTGDQARDATHKSLSVHCPPALTKLGRARLWRMRDEDKPVQEQ